MVCSKISSDIFLQSREKIFSAREEKAWRTEAGLHTAGTRVGIRSWIQQWGPGIPSHLEPFPEASGVKSTQMFYLSKSINTAMAKYSVTSKSMVFKIDLSKSTKVLIWKCIKVPKVKVQKYLKIADLQAHNASRCDVLWACRSAIFKWPRYKIGLKQLMYVSWYHNLYLKSN